MQITECIVDRDTLRRFQRRAYRCYPNEHLEVLVGTVRRNKVRITDFKRCDYFSNKDTVWTDEDILGVHSRTLGTVHTHPNALPEPSQTDIDNAKSEKELVFGICALRKRSKRWFVEWNFFDGSGKRLRLSIVEKDTSTKV